MSEYSAKTLRDKAKARARNLAKPGNYVKDQMTSSADWTPAEPLETTVKTGARPISRRAYKTGGAVKKATGGEIASAIVKRNTKEDIGSKEHVGGFKKGGMAKRTTGGGVLNKKAVGEVQVLPKRAKAENYMCGGKIKKGDGGETLGSKIVKGLDRLTGYKSPAQKLEEGLANVGKGRTSSYSSGDKAALSDIAKGGSGSTLPSDEAEFGKSQNYKKGGMAKRKARATGGSVPEYITKMQQASGDSSSSQTPSNSGPRKGTLQDLMKKGGRVKRATGGAADLRPLSTAAKTVGRATGGRTRGKTDIKINIIAGGKPQQAQPPINLPPPPMPPMGAGAPPPAMPPMGAGAGPDMSMPMARKSGGRISKVASSYKDMTAGSGSGEGRMQKTDIAKKGKDAPARKSGGKVKK